LIITNDLNFHILLRDLTTLSYHKMQDERRKMQAKHVVTHNASIRL